MNIWVSYANEDRNYLNLFESEVGRLSNNQVAVISDNKEFPQNDFNIEIMDRIESSDLQVLLISPYFIVSGYCKKEMGYMFSPSMKSQKIYPITVTEFDKVSLKDPNNKSLATILIKWPGWELVETASLKNGEARKCTWSEFAENILRYLDVDLDKSTKDYTSLRDYKKYFSEGRFVPFIGPECYGLEEEWLPLLPKIQARLNELEKCLTREPDRQFAKAVVKSRVPGFSKQQISIGKSTPEPVFRSTLFPSEFESLRVDIAKAGAAASRILGMSLSKCEDLIDARYSGIKINSQDEDVQILSKALKRAIKIVDNQKDCLNVANESNRMCLGGKGIASKLRILRKSIFLSDSSTEDAATNKTSSTLVLTLSQLDWLGDLFWHTMRLDLPILPRTDELAFQLSVCQATGCIVRVPLGTAGVISAKSSQTAQDDGENDIAQGQEKCTNLIYRHLNSKRKAKQSCPSSNFYHAIAKLIWQPFASENNKSNSSAVNLSSAEVVADEILSKDGRPALHPMAVSVNLDVELENCLENVNVAYSVIYPVQRMDGKASAWMLRVHDPSRKDDFYLLSQRALYEEVVMDKLKGPLIVKLRGSTLHELPPRSDAPDWLGVPTSKISKSDKVDNRLLLSSIDYARELSAPRMGEPICVKTLLGERERVMCFFGYPLDDPDGLLGIQRSVWVAEPEVGYNKPEANSRISVGCHRHDGFGNAFLNGLSVEPLCLELSKVADEINSMGLFDLPRPEVKQ